MRLLEKLLDLFNKKIEFWLISVFYSYMIVMIGVEVLRRYFLHAASTWGEETSIYAFIWLTYVGAALRTRRRRHLSIELVRQYMNEKQKFWTYVLSDICFFSLAVVVTYYSFGIFTTNLQYGQKMLGIELPMALATIGVPIGWALIAFRVVERFLAILKRFRQGQPLIEEETIITATE